MSRSLRFNSCPRAEGNLMGISSAPAVCVSIRALARRATETLPPSEDETWFQFVPSRGGQRTRPPRRFSAARFQFVPSRGGQPRHRGGFSIGLGFNSCPRAEGNKAVAGLIPQNLSFNSCPRAEGNLPIPEPLHGRIAVSIRALARRATGPHG